VIRSVALVIAVAAGMGCSEHGGASTKVEVAAVDAIGCDRPQPRSGVGTFVADGIVLTAAHVVEGDLRDLRVGDAPAAVVGLDVRTDLALVAVLEQIDVDNAPGWDISVTTDPAAGPVTVLTTDGSVEAELGRTLTLRVDDLSDDTLTEREALELDVVVDEGDSGSPVVDGDGNLLGVVVLRRPASGVSYASVVPPLDELVNPVLYQEVRAGPLARSQPCT
jgi:S1-C subfamily serine protease